MTSAVAVDNSWFSYFCTDLCRGILFSSMLQRPSGNPDDALGSQELGFSDDHRSSYAISGFEM